MTSAPSTSVEWCGSESTAADWGSAMALMPPSLPLILRGCQIRFQRDRPSSPKTANRPTHFRQTFAQYWMFAFLHLSAFRHCVATPFCRKTLEVHLRTKNSCFGMRRSLRTSISPQL